MAPLSVSLCFRKVLIVCLLSFVFASIFLCASSETHLRSLSSDGYVSRRILFDVEEHQDQPIKKKSLSSKNQTSKPTKPISTTTGKNSSKLLKTNSTSIKNNQTKLNSDLVAKNQTKLVKLTSSNSVKNKTKSIKTETDNSTSKSSNSTKPISKMSKNSSDLVKLSSPKNKTQSDKKLGESKTMSSLNKNQDKKSKLEKSKKSTPLSWIDHDDEEDEDLVREFRDLPSKFQETLLPDLERISSTSKLYLNKANRHITKGFKPIVGNKYAPTIASIVSFAFILIPLIFVSLIFNRIKAYFSIQKLLIFIQIYLSIYFSILCLSSIVTGLEPLRFFYATAQSTYICVQVMQTLGYIFYLLLLLMYLVLVFGTDTELGLKMLALGQTFVGFAVGLHYYVTVFHRTVLRQPPKSSWKIHAIYAALFLLICWLGTAERRKKAYLEDGGEEGKKN